jgi:periplasmic protein TonB
LNIKDSQEPIVDFAQEQRNPTKHLVGIIIVVIFHILLIYGLVNGLARKVVEVIKQPLETKIIEEVKKLPPDLPPPPPPKLAPPPPAFVPPPEVNVSIAPPAAATITTVTTSVPVAPSPAVARVAPSVGRCPDSDSVYPASARRLEQEGTVMLKVLVGADGQVLDSAVEKTSGFPTLDEAARAAVRQCKGGRAGTAEGQVEQAWVRVKYTFRIQ